MLELQPYNSIYKKQWDEVIANADNGHFMFKRDFMEYHADRFRDCSFLVFYKGTIIGAIPGNVVNASWYSHQGLTFGGLLLNHKYNRILLIRDILQQLFALLQKIGISEATYKFIPHIYHKRPCDGDVYILSKYKRISEYIDVSSAINLQNIAKFSELRIRGKSKANKAGLIYEQTDNWSEFWDVLAQRLLVKYNKTPVHSLAEITSLQTKFKQNIKLFTAQKDTITYAGVIVFETDIVAHCQYISASDLGTTYNALDGLFAYLINYYSECGKKYFNFGISTEDSGASLNENLIQFKEGFGGKSMIHCTYKLHVTGDN